MIIIIVIMLVPFIEVIVTGGLLLLLLLQKISLDSRVIVAAIQNITIKIFFSIIIGVITFSLFCGFGHFLACADLSGCLQRTAALSSVSEYFSKR